MRDAQALLYLAPALLALAAATGSAEAQSKKEWPIHDLERPIPPADSVVLFDGKDLSKWVSQKDGSPAAWKNGYMEVVKGKGGIRTRDGFGDCQLHVEWMAPAPPVGESQDRGNSGVFLMGQYEVQVLDSFDSRTYADGQAGALYGQFPPLVNATRKPGAWQAYDIVFAALRFDKTGTLLRPAQATVFLNGVLVHHAQELTGPTTHKARPPYKAHAAKLPLGLQDHAHPVRFRNIWIRELPEEKP